MHEETTSERHVDEEDLAQGRGVNACQVPWVATNKTTVHLCLPHCLEPEISLRRQYNQISCLFMAPSCNIHHIRSMFIHRVDAHRSHKTPKMVRGSARSSCCWRWRGQKARAFGSVLKGDRINISQSLSWLLRHLCPVILCVCSALWIAKCSHN